MKLILKKIASYIIDSLILGGFVGIYLFCFQIFSLQMTTQKEALLMLVCAFITIMILTCYIPTKTNGQTIGHKIMKLKVLNKDGRPRTYLQSFIRECFIKFTMSTLFIPCVILHFIVQFIKVHHFRFELLHDILLKDIVIEL